MKTTLLLATILLSPSVFAADFHVSPKGDDASGDGSVQKPFATLVRARDAVRAWKAENGGKMKGTANVVPHGGEDRLTETFELTPVDSGEKGKPVCFLAAAGETPVITSARAITGWRKRDDAGLPVTPAARGRLWVADVPKGWRFHALCINGVSQPVIWHGVPGCKVGPAGVHADGIRLALGCLPKDIPLNGDVEVNMRPHIWWNSLAVLTKKDGDNAILSSTNPSWCFGGFNTGPAAIGNALCVLDKPGEWCVDSAAGRVYCWPADGTMEGKTVKAPVLNELVRLQGDDMAARSNAWRVKFDAKGNRVEKTTPASETANAVLFSHRVRFVEFSGLALEDTDRMPENLWPADWLKRNCENPDGALFLQGVEDCRIENCVVRRCGAYAVALDHFARRVTVAANELSELGSGGVQIAGYGPGELNVNSFHLIRRNHIHHTGRAYMHSAAVTIFGSHANDVSLNWMSDCPYAAVAITGANFRTHALPGAESCTDLRGIRTDQFQFRDNELPAPDGDRSNAYSESSRPFQHSDNNWIRRNIADRFMTVLHDGGGLYCWSTGHGTVWSENLLKCLKPSGNAWAIHMDDWTGRTMIEGNIAWMPVHKINEKQSVWQDNSHTPSPDGRPIKMMSIGNTTMPVDWGKTLTVWKNNLNAFPEKPAGFDQLFEAIQADAKAEGGWPKSVTAEMIRQLCQPDIPTGDKLK
jgi:hypothetical protein